MLPIIFSAASAMYCHTALHSVPVQEALRCAAEEPGMKGHARPSMGALIAVQEVPGIRALLCRFR